MLHTRTCIIVNHSDREVEPSQLLWQLIVTSTQCSVGCVAIPTSADTFILSSSVVAYAETLRDVELINYNISRVVFLLLFDNYN